MGVQKGYFRFFRWNVKIVLKNLYFQSDKKHYKKFKKGFIFVVFYTPNVNFLGFLAFETKAYLVTSDVFNFDDFVLPPQMNNFLFFNLENIDIFLFFYYKSIFKVKTISV